MENGGEMSRYLFGLLSVVLCGHVTVAAAQEVAPDYLSVIGAAEKRNSIETVRAEAHVTVSDGLEYDVVTVYHDQQRAIFHLLYPDRRVTLGVEGKYYWSFNGEREEEVPPFYESVVLGHQFHAQLLFFDQLNGPLDAAEKLQCGETQCLSLTGPLGHALHVDETTGRPVGLVRVREDGPKIEIGLARWRDIEGVSLPFLITIDDGERLFEYEFHSVTFNEGRLDDLRAPMSVLTDEQKLLRLHRIAMDAHLFGDAEMMKGTFGTEGVVVSRGEVYPTDAGGSEAMMDRILSNRDYTRYDDLIRPIVRVSDDGSLGWVIVRISAEGVRFDADGQPSGPLEFISAWISMFEKEDGDWKQIGNVSNFMPDE
jgi:hypothetical protein